MSPLRLPSFGYFRSKNKKNQDFLWFFARLFVPLHPISEESLPIFEIDGGVAQLVRASDS